MILLQGKMLVKHRLFSTFSDRRLNQATAGCIEPQLRFEVTSQEGVQRVPVA
jgi:hypothetical protein